MRMTAAIDAYLTDMRQEGLLALADPAPVASPVLREAARGLG